MKTVYGLYRTNKYEIEMLAPDKASADVLRTMSGPGWKVRKLTAAEVADPWVVSTISSWASKGSMVAKEKSMSKADLVSEVDALAENLVGLGDLDAFKEIFGTDDINFDVSKLSEVELQEIYDEYVSDRG